MVETLIYHLPGHIYTIGIKVRIGPKAVDYRNLYACEYPQTVTLGIHQRILWIMCNAKEVAAHFLEQADIPEMHFVGEGVPNIPIILMSVGPYEFEVPSVQEETFVRIEAETPYSKRTTPDVNDAVLCAKQPGNHGI